MVDFGVIPVDKGNLAMFDLIGLDKVTPLERITIQGTWTGSRNRQPIDVDVVLMCLDRNSRPQSVVDLVYFGSSVPQNGIEQVDSRSDNVPEVTIIDFTKLPAHVTSICAYVYLFEGGTFDNILNGGIKIIDTDRNEVTHQLEFGDMAGTDLLRLCMFEKKAGKWSCRIIADAMYCGDRGLALRKEIGATHASGKVF